MGDRSDGWLMIGGTIPPQHLTELCQLMWDEGIGIDWDTVASGEQIEDRIRSFIEARGYGEITAGSPLFTLREIKGGECYAVQDRLRELGLPYIGGCDAGGGYSAAVWLWTPDIAIQYTANNDGEPHISYPELARCLRDVKLMDQTFDNMRRINDRDIPPLRIGGIEVRYTSVDGHTEHHIFDQLSNAQAFAHHWIGRHPEIGAGYAIAGDGVGKITCKGCTLADLFPDEKTGP